MNYRHIYHAGNYSDIFKHAVLCMLLSRLLEKDAAFFVLDTHAGTGMYDLEDARAKKTGEAGDLANAVMDSAIPELQEFRRIIGTLNPQGGKVRYYPGSPSIALKMMRGGDRLALCELHPEDAKELKRRFRNYKRVQIHNRDGYEALNALLPPTEKRGLVLIDPPFERPDEYETLVEAIKTAHKKWPQGIIAAWYPVKERPAIWRFQEAMAKTDIPKISYAEFIYREETRHDRLNGSGFVFVNAPWRMEEKLEEFLPRLHEILQTEHRGVSVFRGL